MDAFEATSRMATQPGAVITRLLVTKPPATAVPTLKQTRLPMAEPRRAFASQ